jgi:DNA-binding NarL/FixJ family response regulator
MADIKVLVVDDHALVRRGLVAALAHATGISVVGQASDGLEAIERAIELKPDVITMDVFMPNCNGLEALISVRERLPDVKVLMLTISDREQDLLDALRFGAQGYVLKSASIGEVVEAVHRTAAGEAMLSPRIISLLVKEFQDKTNDHSLSEREKEVLLAVGEGLTNTEIAHRLFISESTVRTYLQRLLEKLHLRNRAEAVAYAARRYSADLPACYSSCLGYNAKSSINCRLPAAGSRAAVRNSHEREGTLRNSPGGSN